jgi:hypothetical protein
MFPTPRAGKTTDEDADTWLARHAAGKVATPPLSLAVKMLPTPTQQDSKNTAGASQMRRNTPPLNAVVTMFRTPDTGVGGTSGLLKNGVNSERAEM